MRVWTTSVALAVWVAAAGTARARAAAPPAADERVRALEQRLEEQRRSYEARLTEMEERLRRVEFGRRADAETQLRVLTAGLAAAEPQPAGFLDRAARSLQSFNPDLSLVGDFLGHYDSREEAELDEEFFVREIELGFTGAVDPFARYVVFLGIHREHEERAHEEAGQAHEEEEHEREAQCGLAEAHARYAVHVEEAYLTLLTLPLDLQAKVGRFRATFGKVNLMHLHALPWVEYPLVIRRFFGQEGLFGTGVSVNRLVPNPWDLYFEVTYECFNNDSAFFAGEEADDVTHLVHLKHFFDLTAAWTLEVGLSAATAPTDAGHGGRRGTIEGLDVTVRWRHPTRGQYRSFLWTMEVLAAQRETDDGRADSWGAFTAAEYQFALQWAAGVRYDFSECPVCTGLHEHAASVYLTFRQSEYVHWRLAYQASDRNFDQGGSDLDHQVWLQLNVLLGAHPAHVY